MIPVFKVPLPKEGHALLVTQGVAGATTNINNPNHTDIYTDAFPTGITVDMKIDDFLQVWLTCVNCDPEDVEEEEVEEEDETEYEVRILMKPKVAEVEDGD